MAERYTPKKEDLTLRQKELLKQARITLLAIIDGEDRPLAFQPLFDEVLRLAGEIERLLGY